MNDHIQEIVHSDVRHLGVIKHLLLVMGLKAIQECILVRSHIDVWKNAVTKPLRRPEIFRNTYARILVRIFLSHWLCHDHRNSHAKLTDGLTFVAILFSFHTICWKCC